MQWFRIAGSLVAGILVVAHALSVRGGDHEPLRVQQAKSQKAAKLEGRWIVVTHTVDGDEQDTPGAKVNIAEGKFTLEEANGDVDFGPRRVLLITVDGMRDDDPPAF